jgi:hypothetical protein
LADIASNFIPISQSSFHLLRQSAKTGLILLSTKCGTAGEKYVLETLVPKIVLILHSEEFLSISNADLEKYRDPQAAIAAAAVVQEITEADIKITNADRKKDSARSSRRGQFGADLIEDEDWAERIKKEKLKKLTQSKSDGSCDLVEKAKKEVCCMIIIETSYYY